MICRAELRDMSVINEDGVFDGIRSEWSPRSKTTLLARSTNGNAKWDEIQRENYSS